MARVPDAWPVLLCQHYGRRPDQHMARVQIGERWVGDGERVYVVAEAGSNHNGQFDEACSLIDSAADAGADAVKFQNFTAARMYLRSAGRSDYLESDRSIYDIIEEMEMPASWVPRLAEHCRRRGVEFLSSPFDEGSADLIAPHVPAFKIASYEMTHAPLLTHIAGFGKPVILSTGTATLDEVTHAVGMLREAGTDDVVVLQCTARYPAPIDAMNLRAIEAIRRATGCAVGLSDHSRDPFVAPIAAVALGACLIEKHFTRSNQLPGPDHRFSIEPHELRAMVNAVHQAEEALGHGRKELLPAEHELHAFARRSIFATRAIAAGEVLSADNVAVLRCGKLPYGLDPALFEGLLGRPARRPIPAETPIALDDLV